MVHNLSIQRTLSYTQHSPFSLSPSLPFPLAPALLSPPRASLPRHLSPAACDRCANTLPFLSYKLRMCYLACLISSHVCVRTSCVISWGAATQSPLHDHRVPHPRPRPAVPAPVSPVTGIASLLDVASPSSLGRVVVVPPSGPAVPGVPSLGGMVVPGPARVMVSRRAGGARAVVHAPAGGGRLVSSPSAGASVVRTRGTARAVGAHRRTQVSAVRPAVPQAVHAESQGLGPVRVAGEEVALLLEVPAGIRVAHAAASGTGVGRGGVAAAGGHAPGVAVEHAVDARAPLLGVGRVAGVVGRRRRGVVLAARPGVAAVVRRGATVGGTGRPPGGPSLELAAAPAGRTAPFPVGIPRILLDPRGGVRSRRGLLVPPPRGLVGREDALAQVGRRGDVARHPRGTHVAGIGGAGVLGGGRRGGGLVGTARGAHAAGGADRHGLEASSSPSVDARGLPLRDLVGVHARGELPRSVVLEDGLVGEGLAVAQLLGPVADEVVEVLVLPHDEEGHYFRGVVLLLSFLGVVKKNFF
mmetsp:Transcript_4083/g.8636  ORF Transcript_4083/g.8636 Transcript_4083/m.8636 type:complete len:527 (-) Transcript_4083:15-1595(-)